LTLLHGLRTETAAVIVMMCLEGGNR
jgi:hypothetical protein